MTDFPESVENSTPRVLRLVRLRAGSAHHGGAHYPLEIITTLQRIYLFREDIDYVRQMELNIADHGDLLPTRMEQSLAHWVDNELVVETTHILPLHVRLRFPSSLAQMVVERFCLLEVTHSTKPMQVDLTIIDPLVYQEPIIVRMVYKSAPEVALGEYICGQDLWDQHVECLTSQIP